MYFTVKLLKLDIITQGTFKKLLRNSHESELSLKTIKLNFISLILYYLHVLYSKKKPPTNLTNLMLLAKNKSVVISAWCNQGRIKTALGPGAMTYCRARHHNNDIYIYIYICMGYIQYVYIKP